MTYAEALKIIERSDGYDLARAYSDYSIHVLADPDGALYPMEDFDEIVSGFSPTKLAKMIFYGTFNPFGDLFTFNEYGHLESVNASDVADFITYRLSAEDLINITPML